MNEIRKPKRALFVNLWKLTGWFWVGFVVFSTLSQAVPVDIVVINEKGKIAIYSDEGVNAKKILVSTISLGHIAAYGLLMWWFAQLSHRKRYLKVAILFLLMGTGLEFAQELIPDRNLSLSDMVGNLGGTLLGWVFALTHSQLFYFDKVSKT